jgi:hypothetical protein
VGKSQAFVVAADHDGVDTDGYRLRQNNTIVADVPASALSGGVIGFNFSQGLAVGGTYTYTISAYNNDDPANEATSASITLTVKRAKPKSPANIRVVK